MVPDIRKARMEMGWTQQELADAVGCTNTHISHLENGRAMGSVDLYERIAAECDVALVMYFTDISEGQSVGVSKRKRKKKKKEKR